MKKSEILFQAPAERAAPLAVPPNPPLAVPIVGLPTGPCTLGGKALLDQEGGTCVTLDRTGEIGADDGYGAE